MFYRMDETNPNYQESGKYIVQIFGSDQMYSADTFEEMTCAIVGRPYLDCETAEVAWLARQDSAKRIGLMLNAMKDCDNIIMYDERAGKLPYSYTSPNPDYAIPENPVLIRLEDDLTFMYSLALIGYVVIFEKIDGEYVNIKLNKDLAREIEEKLVIYRPYSQNVPLHQKLSR